MEHAIESMFAWTGFRLRKPTAKRRLTSKVKDIFQEGMTPDHVPQFFIPNLAVAHEDFHLKSVKLPEDLCLERRLSDAINSKSPSVQCSSEHSKEKSMKKRETWYKEDSLFLAKRLADCKSVQSARHHSDPTRRAAPSLSHLPRVTIPDRLLTLGESPNLPRE